MRIAQAMENSPHNRRPHQCCPQWPGDFIRMSTAPACPPTQNPAVGWGLRCGPGSAGASPSLCLRTGCRQQSSKVRGSSVASGAGVQRGRLLRFRLLIHQVLGDVAMGLSRDEWRGLERYADGRSALLPSGIPRLINLGFAGGAPDRGRYYSSPPALADDPPSSAVRPARPVCPGRTAGALD